MNPPDRDFCECGEYLRWEPTGFVQAITPEMAEQAAAEAAPEARDPPPALPAPPIAKTEIQPAVPVPPAPPARPAAALTEPDTARITLRHPDRAADYEGTLGLSIEPGQRERVMALVRNQGGIVDNYQLRVEGMPGSCWSIYPDTVYLVPFGTGGTYEQEVEIHLHPPRAPDVEAKLWDLQVVAHSKAQGRPAASAPLGLVVEPYTETATSIRPQRVKGRRKAHYDVAVENKANAPVLVALEGEDDDDELGFGFNRPPLEIPPGQTIATGMQARPRKQIWIGRAVERRFTVKTLTGEQAAERLAAEPEPASEAEGVHRSRAYMPQVYKPGIQIGPGGVTFQKPQVAAPQLAGRNIGAGSLEMPGKRAQSAPAGPLQPSQGVFRQKPWLPWWMVPVAIALAALAVLLYMLLPQNVVVPDVIGAESTFEAEKELTEAGLTLAASPKEKVDRKAPAGSIIDQTPPAGEKAEEGAPVTVLVAIGSAEVAVPDLAGMTLSEADAALRDEKLTLGQSSPQSPDPDGRIESQIPAKTEVVNVGTPVSVFFEDPSGARADDGEKDGSTSPDKPAKPKGDAIVPEIDGATAGAYAQRLAGQGIVPRTRTIYDVAPRGTLLSTEPPEGSKVGPSGQVTLVVSAGAPLLAYDDEQDVLVVNGITGKDPTVVGRSAPIDKDPTFSADGERIAYQAGGQVFLAAVDDPDGQPLPLTDGSRQFRDLAFAPTLERDVLAMLGEQPSTGLRQLCLGRVIRGRVEPTCIDSPAGVELGSTIRWAPDGRTLLIFGNTVDDRAQFGIVRYRSPRPFSARADDWSTSGYVTDVTQPGRGIIDAAFSPDGKRLAIVSNLITRAEFQVLMTTPADLGREPGKAIGVTACKVTWRPDGIELVVMQADDCVGTAAGRILGIPLKDPQSQRSLRLEGDNMTFAPLKVEP